MFEGQNIDKFSLSWIKWDNMLCTITSTLILIVKLQHQVKFWLNFRMIKQEKVYYVTHTLPTVCFQLWFQSVSNINKHEPCLSVYKIQLKHTLWSEWERRGEERRVALRWRRRKCWNSGWYYLSWREGREGGPYRAWHKSVSPLSVEKVLSISWHNVTITHNTTHSNIFKKCSAKCLSICDRAGENVRTKWPPRTQSTVSHLIAF